jgi:hypothetical protein
MLWLLLLWLWHWMLVSHGQFRKLETVDDVFFDYFYRFSSRLGFSNSFVQIFSYGALPGSGN